MNVAPSDGAVESAPICVHLGQGAKAGSWLVAHSRVLRQRTPSRRWMHWSWLHAAWMACARAAAVRLSIQGSFGLLGLVLGLQLPALGCGHQLAGRWRADQGDEGAPFRLVQTRLAPAPWLHPEPLE